MTKITPFPPPETIKMNKMPQKTLKNLNRPNLQALKDPLYVLIGPITRARSKKIKEALNGLILTQDITSMAQKKMKA